MDAERARTVVGTFVLHLRPVRVPEGAIRFTHTFGLGGMSLVLLLLLRLGLGLALALGAVRVVCETDGSMRHAKIAKPSRPRIESLHASGISTP